MNSAARATARVSNSVGDAVRSTGSSPSATASSLRWRSAIASIGQSRSANSRAPISPPIARSVVVNMVTCSATPNLSAAAPTRDSQALAHTYSPP
ncbi:Uncharacterised protein [Mycobacteroides abscessus subsp. abscessus]|nr:Uncharacterised protein [Mycobacteroides abscessus subsp. abscessus]